MMFTCERTAFNAGSFLYASY